MEVPVPDDAVLIILEENVFVIVEVSPGSGRAVFRDPLLDPPPEGVIFKGDCLGLNPFLLDRADQPVLTVIGVGPCLRLSVIRFGLPDQVAVPVIYIVTFSVARQLISWIVRMVILALGTGLSIPHRIIRSWSLHFFILSSRAKHGHPSSPNFCPSL